MKPSICPYCGSADIELLDDANYVCRCCERLFDEDDCEHQKVWRQISLLLNGTSAESPKVMGDGVILPSIEAESCGLRDNEKLNIDRMHQIEGDGTMWYHFEFTPDEDDYWYDMSELSTEDLKYILNAIENE